MPNRILKESICNSEDINQLRLLEEITFYRLIVSCDDYGTLDARPKILKAKLFPIKDEIDIEEIDRIILGLCAAGLITLYENDGRLYLHLNKWNVHQRVRNFRSKYPKPLDEGSQIIEKVNFRGELPQVAASCGELRPKSLSLSLSKSLSKSESLSGSISIYDTNSQRESIPYEVIVQLYHDICTTMPKISIITAERKKTIKTRWKQSGSDMNSFEAVFLKAAASDFLSGRDGKWTGCNFDWLIKSANFVKVGEGIYDNRQVNDPIWEAAKGKGSNNNNPFGG
jgi:hypothetical protein